MQAINMPVEDPMAFDFPGETFLAFADEQGLDSRLFCVFAGCEGIYDPQKALAVFNACKAGAAANLESWAKKYFETSGLLQQVPEAIRPYFNYGAWARDAEQKGDIWVIELYDDEIAVFFSLTSSFRQQR